MIPSDNDIKRQVIPRRRTIKATTQAGELASSKQEQPSQLEGSLAVSLARELQLRVREWREELDVASAEELLAAAAVSGNEQFKDDILAAARKVIDDPLSLPGSLELAKFSLGDVTADEDPTPSQTRKMYAEIARRKLCSEFTLETPCCLLRLRCCIRIWV